MLKFIYGFVSVFVSKAYTFAHIFVIYNILLVTPIICLLVLSSCLVSFLDSLYVLAGTKTDDTKIYCSLCPFYRKYLLSMPLISVINLPNYCQPYSSFIKDISAIISSIFVSAMLVLCSVIMHIFLYQRVHLWL